MNCVASVYDCVLGVSMLDSRSFVPDLYEKHQKACTTHTHTQKPSLSVHVGVDFNCFV